MLDLNYQEDSKAGVDMNEALQRVREKVDIAKGQSEAKLELSANASATPGEHQGTLRLRHKLGLWRYRLRRALS